MGAAHVHPRKELRPQPLLDVRQRDEQRLDALGAQLVLAGRRRALDTPPHTRVALRGSDTSAAGVRGRTAAA